MDNQPQPNSTNIVVPTEQLSVSPQPDNQPIVPVQNSNIAESKPFQSRLGLYGLLSSVLVAAVDMVSTKWLISATSGTASNTTFYITYIGVSIGAMVSLFVFIIPSLRKIQPPNIIGLIALGISLITIYLSVTGLVNLLLGV